MSEEACFYWGFCVGGFWQVTISATQKGRTWFSEKIHAAKAVNQVVEPEAGRMVQSQMSNLVIGVVPCPSRITHATSDRVGACGAKLLNGFNVNTSGEAGLQLPFRFAAQFTSIVRPPQAPVSSVKGSPQAGLLRS
jgi:hypothetical protein